jgi:acyl-CoA synthetase (AMP-forming)/AMP-acid ligase II
MFLALQVGNLSEPLSGRCWDQRAIMQQFYGRLAYYQAQGMRDADRVFLHYGNTLEFFVDLLAVWSLGGCVIPIDPRLTPFELDILARAAAPRFSLWRDPPDDPTAACLSALDIKILATSEVVNEVAVTQAPVCSSGPLSLDQDALILFTSGTTGQPRGVVHTHRSLRARWTALRQCLGLAKFRRTLCLLPTHFGHGLICNCLFPWLSGQDLFILPPFRPDVMLHLGELLDEHEITFMSSVPVMWQLALKTAKPPRSRMLERVFCGSAPLSADLWKEIQEWAGTREVLNAYGITETGSWMAGTTVPDFIPEDGLIGAPWGAMLKILPSASSEEPPGLVPPCAAGEPGYVWIHTPALMQGYLGRDDLTKQVVSHGWFMTGDIGFLDDRGLLHLRGRAREEINKGGIKVYPGDIDTVVERFESTVDVCSFGYDATPHGQDVGVAVVLQGAGDETIRHLYDWVRRHVAQYQMPARWYIVDALPRTSRGKLNRAQVAAMCASLSPVNLRQLLRGDMSAGRSATM